VNGIPEIFGGAIECLLHSERVLKPSSPEGELGHNSTSGRSAPSWAQRARCGIAMLAVESVADALDEQDRQAPKACDQPRLEAAIATRPLGSFSREVTK
jgi:hypothetical protein